MTAQGSRLAVAAVPVVLVNVVAFAGQLAFLRAHLHWALPGQLMMAAALESIAVYLAFHAHVAQLANDSALRLRLASYGFAAVIAVMNYSHYAAPGWRPTFPAVAVGLMSASSPWLWAVHSRRASRDAMMAAGLIEPHALRLGATRWLWHPARSARVMYHATWEGITDPREAIAGWDASRSRNRAVSRYPGARQAPPQAGSQTGPRESPELADGQVRETPAGPVRPALPGPERDGDGGPVRPRPASRTAHRSRKRNANRPGKPVTGPDAEQEFAAEIAAGHVPSLYAIRTRLHVGNERAKSLRQYIARQALST